MHWWTTVTTISKAVHSSVCRCCRYKSYWIALQWTDNIHLPSSVVKTPKQVQRWNSQLWEMCAARQSRDDSPDLSESLLLAWQKSQQIQDKGLNVRYRNKFKISQEKMCHTVPDYSACYCMFVLVFSAHVEVLCNLTGRGDPEEHKHPLAPPTLPSHLGEEREGGGWREEVYASVCVCVLRGKKCWKKGIGRKGWETMDV